MLLLPTRFEKQSGTLGSQSFSIVRLYMYFILLKIFKPDLIHRLLKARQGLLSVEFA